MPTNGNASAAPVWRDCVGLAGQSSTYIANIQQAAVHMHHPEPQQCCGSFGRIREWDRNPRLLRHHVKESAPPYGTEVILARLSKVEDKVDKLAEQVARLVTTMAD